MLIQDTDLLSTVIYSRHYFGDCPGWVEAHLARANPPTSTCLAGIDVPWVPDGDQRDRERASRGNAGSLPPCALEGQRLPDSSRSTASRGTASAQQPP